MALPRLPAYVPGGASPAVAKAIVAASQPKKKSTSITSGIGGASGYNLLNPIASTPTFPGVPTSPGVPGSSPTVPGGFDYGGDLTPQVDYNAYLTQLKNDPMYQNADVAYNAAISSGRSALADQIKQMVIRGGWGQQLKNQMPSNLSQYGDAIDQATIDTASANPLSTRAQLNQQLSRQQSDLAYGLASRGTLGGGGFATGNTALSQGYDQASNDAMNQLLDTIGQGASNYDTFAQNATSARDSAYAAAAARLAQVQASGPAQMTPGGNPMDAIAAALPGDTNNTLTNSILNTPNFDYNALDRALGIPSQADILKLYFGG